MELKNKKTNDTTHFKRHENDSGSIEYQIAVLTQEIIHLTEHFKKFPKDFGSKRGLTRKVSRRNKYLCYVERTNKQAYEQLIQQLGLRK